MTWSVFLSNSFSRLFIRSFIRRPSRCHSALGEPALNTRERSRRYLGEQFVVERFHALPTTGQMVESPSSMSMHQHQQKQRSVARELSRLLYIYEWSLASLDNATVWSGTLHRTRASSTTKSRRIKKSCSSLPLY